MGTTRTAERSDALQGLPMWARVTAIVGIPGVIAIYLVYILGSALPTQLEAHAAETRMASERQIRLLQQICSNTAGTPEERASCWSVRP